MHLTNYAINKGSKNFVSPGVASAMAAPAAARSLPHPPPRPGVVTTASETKAAGGSGGASSDDESTAAGPEGDVASAEEETVGFVYGGRSIDRSLTLVRGGGRAGGAGGAGILSPGVQRSSAPPGGWFCVIPLAILARLGSANSSSSACGCLVLIGRAGERAGGQWVVAFAWFVRLACRSDAGDPVFRFSFLDAPSAAEQGERASHRVASVNL